MTDPIPEDGLVVFHKLAFRPDGADWLVGRLDAGPVVALPEEGALAIRLLQQGLSPSAAGAEIERTRGRRVSVETFVASLAALGFVARTERESVGGPAEDRSSLPGLRAAGLRWTLSPWLHVGVIALVLAGTTVGITDPGVLPRWRDFFWSDSGSLILLGQAALSWPLILLHELAHLCTARAAGVGGRIRLGTRLQFLVVQTEVTGVWLCDRRTRVTVYMSGIGLNLALASGCLLWETAAGANRLLSLVVLIEVGSVLCELLVFMRTDVYFLLQDLLRCRNLYGDASAYCHFLLARLVRRNAPNPLAALGRREQRRVRAYAVLMVAGTGAALFLAYQVYTKVTFVLFVHAIHGLTDRLGWPQLLDSCAVLTILVGVQGLWLTAWWRRHGPRVLAAVRRDSR
ncbi:hypothetical protein [Streptacidiphilus sp. EB103A]|uniref:hypothetical protein n=1 Tax=Streptacidiphilus sp. EB103A TaxID=3156275 RepID=UPI003513A8C9